MKPYLKHCQILKIVVEANNTVKEWVEELDKFAPESQSEEIRSKAVKVFTILKIKNPLIDYILYRLESQTNDKAQDNEETNKTDEDIKQELKSPNTTQARSQNESKSLYSKRVWMV
ncbi:unnamed protein product [Brachionus calyciflorus]|uniref:Uncharacterized protein n=1 Tax=Brachionus calyciflorus TaxID=104777 RepID=A0A814HFJ9_9BILA|nr:unnamed protein product [Brachionus calyciflorus]